MEGNDIFNLLFIFLEIHSAKIVLLATAITCCVYVDALHGVLLCIVLVGMLTRRYCIHVAVIKISSLYVSFLVISKMAFMTKFFQHTNLKVNCSSSSALNHVRFAFEPNAAWLGYDSEKLTAFKGYFTVISLSTLLRAVHISLIMRRKGRKFLTRSVMFPEVRRENADISLTGTMKFLLNYGFHKFGVEICKVTMAALVVQRRDVFGFLYGICLLIILLLSRNTLRRIWTLLSFYIAFCFICQYAMAVGVFPSLCYENPLPMNDILRNWLFLPSHNRKLQTDVIIGDVLLLMMFRQQGTVFCFEEEEHPAGSNTPMYKYFNRVDYKNPIPDHTNHTRPVIDRCKSVTFTTLYWANLAVSFTIGSASSDLISLGYLIGAFIIIWQGADLYLWEIARLTKWWNFFTFYAICSMTLKAALSSLDCMEGDEVWRWTSRATLLLQSSGAVLIEQLQHEQVEREREERRRTLNKIKADMATIKTYNDSVLNPNGLGPPTHDHAILQGDYCMFEDVVQLYRKSDESGKTPVRRRRTVTLDELIGALKNRSDHSSLRTSKIDGHQTEEETIMKFLNSRRYTDEEGTVRVDQPKTAEQEQEPKKYVRICYILQFVVEVLENTMLDIIPILNKASHNFRVVAWTMKKSKADLKSKNGTKYESESDTSITQPDWEEFERIEELKKNEPVVLQFLSAVWLALVANTELLCYLAVFLHQILIPSLLSLPLPLMILLWGTLTAGRPSPTFWTTIIAYTQVIMLIKALFQNDLFPWTWSSHKAGNIFHPPTVIGIEHHGFAFPDITLLLILFIHRKKLKTFGLWVHYRHPTSANLQVVSFVDESAPQIRYSFQEHLRSICHFFSKFRQETVRLPVDVYTFSFLCEFLSFIIVFFGYSSFSAHAVKDGARFYLAENEVPTAYLVSLIIQFFVILLDRVLYLRKNIIGKLISYIVLVLLSHIWLFVLLPIITFREFVNLAWPQVWYLFKYTSFLLSAYQIRTGYPMRVQGHFLCKNYNYINYWSNKVLGMIPFFVPIRQMITWLCVKTSLNFTEWFLLGSMSGVIFFTKCNRRAAADYPIPRGVPCPNVGKWINGILVLGVMILIIWSPLILFAVFNSVAEPAPPTDARFTLKLNTFEDLYSYHLKEDEIEPLTLLLHGVSAHFYYEVAPNTTQAFRLHQLAILFTENDFKRLKGFGRINSNVRIFLEQYEQGDISICKLNPASKAAWIISPGNLEQLKNAAQNTTGNLELHFSWEFQRRDTGEAKELSTGDYYAPLKAHTRAQLVKALTDKHSIVRINTKVPLYFERKNGEARPIVFFDEDGPFGYGKMVLTLKSSDGAMWWEVSDKCEGEMERFRRQQYSQPDCERVVIYIFSQKRLRGFLHYLTAKGIIGLYLSFVVFVWYRVKPMFFATAHDIKYSCWPNADSLLQLMKDIDLARESHEFALEEDLFAKLLFLFRSPETMIKWTRIQESQEIPLQAIQE